MRRGCGAAGRTPGAVVPLAQAWRLAQVWYADRLTPGWRRRTAAESQALLESVGLTGPAWQLG